MEMRIGISGWLYPPWRKIFYPEDLPQKKELSYASRQVNSIEINGSFYSYQRPETYQRWFSEVPDDFKFSVKGPRYITHILRLRDPKFALSNFFASGVLCLEYKLGAFLWQLPPNFLFDPDRLDEFLGLLPKNFADAAALAHQSERFQKKYSDAITHSKRRLRHALEIRHHSFENPDFIALLRKHNVALVFADTAGKWPYMEDVTSNFVYLRLHGDEEIYKSGYDEPTLRWWADRIRTWSKGLEPRDALRIGDSAKSISSRDVFVYFDNDIKVRAPADARSLSKMLKVAKAVDHKQILIEK
ncbi:DUF72 domain-containing protein [Bdellovibrio sp. HCB2-146]|uniref:DUF72 domain-containing protein n=1 Tax=Bdellovibrio sp. HCB2-146 TaxID=3394362 RepID=UPI0039BD4C44